MWMAAATGSEGRHSPFGPLGIGHLVESVPGLSTLELQSSLRWSSVTSSSVATKNTSTFALFDR